MAFDKADALNDKMQRRCFLKSLSASGILLATGARAALPSAIPDIDLRLNIDPAVPDKLHPLIEKWIGKSADAVRHYYGKFPVPVLELNIGAAEGNRVSGGRSEPDIIPRIEINVGAGVTDQYLLVRDWVMVHEMIHMAIPYVPRRHFWAAEGLAVYVESIARLQLGHVAQEQVWRDFIRQMPRGLPKADEGLAFSRDHGRIYWGGALFFLLADVRIREATNNKLGLQHALRGINATMDFREEMDVVPILHEGDKATSTSVLMALYHEMAMQGGKPDMAKLWGELGVAANGDGVTFDASAPMASIRKAITA